jgi:hypothetical protein
MAKMFYTLEETKAALGQGEDQIKQLTREGRLREFRDGPRLMFKADQVDALKSQMGGGGSGGSGVAMEMHDSGLPIGLADTGGGTGVGLSMADSIGSGIGSGSGLSALSGSGLSGISGSGLGSGLTGGAGSGMMNLKEDTALAADLGLSGTVGGIPSPGRSGGGSGSGVGSGSATGSSRQGINVFGDETHAGADPMAQTAMPSAGSMADLNLEGIGSGSGLLDLTRESDETSLGAELLDEISPSGKGGRPLAPPDTGSMAGIKLDAPRGGVMRGGGVVQVEAYDGWSTAFGWMAMGVSFFVLFGLFALVNGVVGFQPDAVKYFDDKPFAMIAGVGAVIAVLSLAFGKLVSMSGGKR